MADGNISLDMPIITRAEAKAAGLSHYFSGKPCRKGHVAEHYVCGGCVACHRLRAATYRTANREKLRAYNKAWCAVNPDKVRASLNRYRTKYPERAKASTARYNAANAEHVKARKARYREANRIKQIQYNRTRYALNRDQLAEKQRARQQARPEIFAAYARNRHARKKAAEGHHTAEDIQRIYRAQNGRCAICKTKLDQKYDVDHIKPLKLGGSNWPANLQILCKTCNCSKNAKDPIDHMQSLGFLL